MIIARVIYWGDRGGDQLASSIDADDWELGKI